MLSDWCSRFGNLVKPAFRDYNCLGPEDLCLCPILSDRGNLMAVVLFSAKTKQFEIMHSGTGTLNTEGAT